MNRNFNKLAVLVALSSLACASLGWEVTTTPAKTKWFSDRAYDLENDCKVDFREGDGIGYRPTCIDILYNQNAYNWYGYTTVRAPLVKNTGAHYKKWDFVYDYSSPQQVADFANTHGYTVVDLEEYYKDGSLRYAALMEDFDPWKSYFIYCQTNTAGLTDFLFSQNGYGGKIVDMDVDDYGQSSTLHGAMLFSYPLTGVNWNSTLTWDQIPGVNNGSKRLLDLQRWNPNGGSPRFCALWCDLKPGEQGRVSYFSTTSFSWIEDQEAYGWRVQTINRCYDNGDLRYAGVLVWNK